MAYPSSLMLVISIFIANVLLFYILFAFKKLKFIKFSWSINGFCLPVLPFIGTMYIPFIAGYKDNVVAAVGFMGQKFGFPFNLWHGHNYHYCTNDPLEAKALLHSLCAQNKGVVYRDISYVFRNSLLTIPYQRWRIRRKQYAKCFKPQSLKPFSGIYYNGSQELVKDIKANKDISYDFFNKYAFSNFFYTSSGLDKEPIGMHRLGECLMAFQEDVAQKLLDPLTPPGIWLRFYAGGKNTVKNMKEITSINKQIIEQKSHQRSDFKAFVESESAPPLLDLMMSIKGTTLDDESICDDMVFFSAAIEWYYQGQEILSIDRMQPPADRFWWWSGKIIFFHTLAADTSGHSLMIGFTLLGMHPEVQEKVYNELISTVGLTKSITCDDLPALVYTEAFIHETLRLFPVIPIVSRQVDDDVDIGTKIIPKGANVLISLYHMHRDEKYWSDPLTFDPDRFLPENASKIKPFSYMAFSSGPRDCLGKAQAMAMLKISYASVVRNFKITSKHKSIDELKCMSSITLRTIDAVDCHFAAR